MSEGSGEDRRRPSAREQGRETVGVLERHKSLVRPVTYWENIITGPERALPYFDFSALTKSEQRTIMGEFYEAAVSDGKPVILEVGPGERLSPLETAVARPDSVVFAVDDSFQPRNRYGSKMAKELAHKAEQRKTFAAFFGLDATALHERLKFDRVQMMFPTPYDLPEFSVAVSKHVKPGGELVVVSDPLTSGEPTAEDVERVLGKDFSSMIRQMSLHRIKESFGFSDSELRGDELIPVLVARRSG